MVKKILFEGREYVASSFSGANHNCVGVSIEKDNVSVINTNTMEKVINFTHEEWRAFITGAKNNEFDLK